MSVVQLKASLALWRTRYRWRDARWNYWRRRANKPLVLKWETLRLEALDRIHLRERQIAEAEHRTILMIDSVTATAIPVTAQAAAGYVNGKYANIGEIEARCRAAKAAGRIVSITIDAAGVAHCLDVETGDATPGEAAGWVRRESGRLAKQGRHPIVYANASTMPEVKAALAGLPRSSYRLWVASYDHEARVPAGFDAHQYEEDAKVNVDRSVCYPTLFN